MGFDLYYSTTEKISPALQREIIADAESLEMARSWVQCSGLSVENDDGLLTGSSRLFSSDPDMFAEAKISGKPLGKLRDLLQALCDLSARHGIEWEIEHDDSEGVVGLIQYGVADDAVRGTFDGLEAMLEGMSDGTLPDDLDEPFG